VKIGSDTGAERDMIHAAIVAILTDESPLFAMDILHRLQARDIRVSRRTFGTTVSDHLRDDPVFKRDCGKTIGDACAWRLAGADDTIHFEPFLGEVTVSFGDKRAYLSRGVRNHLGDPRRVKWGAQRDGKSGTVRIIGVRAARDDEESAYTLDQRNGTVQCALFLDWIGMPTLAGVKLRGEWHEDEGWVAFAILT
jgi:hypothetical protein